MKVFSRATAGSTSISAVDALRAELQLLREENARLRVQAHKAQSGGRSVYQLASLREEADQLAALQHVSKRAADATDDAWQTFADAIVMRDALLEVCDELIGLTERLRARLEALGLGLGRDGHATVFSLVDNGAFADVVSDSTLILPGAAPVASGLVDVETPS